MKNYGNIPLTNRQQDNKRYYEKNKNKLLINSAKKYKIKADKIKLDDAIKLVMEKMGGMLRGSTPSTPTINLKDSKTLKSCC